MKAMRCPCCGGKVTRTEQELECFHCGVLIEGKVTQGNRTEQAEPNLVRGLYAKGVIDKAEATHWLLGLGFTAWQANVQLALECYRKGVKHD